MVDSNHSPTTAVGTRSMPSRPTKSAAAFRTISEVATDLDVAQHVLRFWESKFPQVRPLKRGGGRRYYRPEDVELLRTIRSLLYEEGYTIKGAQKLLKGSRRAPEGGDAGAAEGGEAAAALHPPAAPRPPAAAAAAPPAPAAGSNSSHGGGTAVAARGVLAPPPPAEMRGRLEQLRDELVNLRDMLRRAAE